MSTLVFWPGYPWSFLKKGEFLSLIISEYMNRKNKGALLGITTRLLFSIYMLVVLIYMFMTVIKGFENKRSLGTIFGGIGHTGVTWVQFENISFQKKAFLLLPVGGQVLDVWSLKAFCLSSSEIT